MALLVDTEIEIPAGLRRFEDDFREELKRGIERERGDPQRVGLDDDNIARIFKSYRKTREYRIDAYKHTEKEYVDKKREGESELASPEIVRYYKLVEALEKAVPEPQWKPDDETKELPLPRALSA